MTISEEQMWAAKEKQWRTVISPSYKLLVENSAEENNTIQEKKVKLKTSMLWFHLQKRKKPKSETSMRKYLQLCQNHHYHNLKSKILSRREQSRTIEPSGLNSEPNIFTDELDSKIFILKPKIKLGVLVILLHCTSYLNYPTFKNIRLLTRTSWT